MQNQDLYQLFVNELEDMLSAENQIVNSLPKLIQLASLKDLKEALTDHLKETKTQVTRINKIISILGINVKENTCEAMQGLLREATKIVGDTAPSVLLDAAIISAAQKVEHYEIASYGSLRSFAKYLDFDSEILDLLQDSLDEEAGADKKLTKIAEGSLFFGGVNKQAAEVSGRPPRK